MRKELEKETAAQRRIVVFCPLYPPHVGGLESHAQQWNEEMAKLGYSIVVWTPHIAGGLTEEEVGGVKVLRFPAWQIVANYPVPKFWHPVFWKQLRKIKQFLQPTTYSLKPVLVSRTRFFLTSLMAFAAGKLTGTPWLHIEHGSDFVQLTSPVPRLLARLYDYTLGQLVLRQATAVVANSQASAAFIQKLSSRKVDAVIYRGVDQEKIASIVPAAITTTYKVPPTTSVITYVGRLISSKGVQDLIAALAILKEQNWHCWIIGDGPHRASLERQARQTGVAKHISFLGEKPWSDTIAHMKASDVIVNPSYTEGLPTSVIEAALSKTPIIATDVGGTREVFTDGQSGILIHPHNPKGMAEAIATLLTNHTMRQQLVEQAFEEVSKKFSWPTALEKYQHLCAAL